MSTDADPYAPLAAVYDEWHEALAPIWVLRVENHLARFGVSTPAPSFLDLGCGTGTLLVALRHRHAAWRLAGLDASAAMLGEQGRSRGRTPSPGSTRASRRRPSWGGSTSSGASSMPSIICWRFRRWRARFRRRDLRPARRGARDDDRAALLHR